jgi:hypothetical protein
LPSSCRYHISPCSTPPYSLSYADTFLVPALSTLSHANEIFPTAPCSLSHTDKVFAITSCPLTDPHPHHIAPLLPLIQPLAILNKLQPHIPKLNTHVQPLQKHAAGKEVDQCAVYAFAAYEPCSDEPYGAVDAADVDYVDCEREED